MSFFFFLSFVLTDILLLELSRDVSLNERRLSHAAVADEDKLELRHFLRLLFNQKLCFGAEGRADEQSFAGETKPPPGQNKTDRMGGGRVGAEWGGRAGGRAEKGHEGTNNRWPKQRGHFIGRLRFKVYGMDYGASLERNGP